MTFEIALLLLVSAGVPIGAIVFFECISRQGKPKADRRKSVR